MKENYLINIEGIVNGENDTDTISLLTRGSFVSKNGNFFISYKETAATGFAGNITTVKVEPQGKVSMLRFGNAPSQLVIEPGRRHVCHYDSRHGILTLGVAADEIDNKLSPSGGKLSFSYTLDSDNAHISHNRVNITVREVS